MKILHINEKGTLPFGGGEKYLSGICNDLERAGHEIVIISSSTWLRNNLAVLAQTPQTPCSMLNTRRRRGGEGVMERGIKGRESSIQYPVSSMRREYLVEACPGFRNGLRVIDEVRAIVQRENPDVVNLHGILDFLNPLIVIVLHSLKPTVQFIHYVGPFCLNGQKILAHQDQMCDLAMGLNCFNKRCLSGSTGKFIYNIRDMGLSYVKKRCLFDFAGKFICKMRDIGAKFCELEVIKRLDKIIVGSKYMHGQLLRNGFSEKRMVVIPCYTDKISATSKPFTDENVILFVGRLQHTKGIYQFIQSLNLIRNKKWQAKIIGDGEEKNKAVYLTKRLGLSDRIHFVGKMPFEMVDAYYERCTLVVMPSMMPESFGLVGIEAMAFGKPVVAFNVGGVAEWLVQNETGFLVERGNIQELADRIAQLLDDKALAAKLGSAGQRQVEKRFRRDNHINGLTKIYAEAIEMRKRMDYPAVL